MPPRPSPSSGHLHKKRRPVSIISSRESSLSPSHHASFPQSITWGSNKAYLPYHEEEYNREISVPHPHYRSNAKQGYQPVPDELYGVPVLADQVDFMDHQDGPALPREEKQPYLKRLLRKNSKKAETHGPVTPSASYPPELVGMSVPERQELAEQAQRNVFHDHGIDGDDHRPPAHHHAKSRKSVPWDPELGSVTTCSSVSPADGPSSSENVLSTATWQSSADSVASDKTIWPFPRKPKSLSDKRPKPSSSTPPSFVDPESPLNPIDKASESCTGFEFTPRIYVPLWKPTEAEPMQLDLPSTPEPSPSRHRRTLSIRHPRWKPPTPATAAYPPAFTEPQLSPSPYRQSSASASSWPLLPPFGSTKVYTPPSPYEHSIAALAQHQAYQADMGAAKGKWNRVDFRNGDAESSPSRTFRHAAEDWLRTQ